MSNTQFDVIDVKVFLDLFRRYYTFDIAPAFWQALVKEASNGNLRSIDRVLDELKRNNDELTRWATRQFRR